MESIFIGGYMHSGTSMLVNILNKHSDIYAVTSELRLFESYPTFNHKHNNDEKYVNNILGKLSLTDDEVRHIESQKRTLMEESSTTGQLTVRLIESLKEFNGNLYWAEKTPSNVFFIDKIFERFPNSKIILIYRDIRSIIASKKVRTLDLKTDRYDNKNKDIKKLEKDWNVLADSFSWLGTIKAQTRALKKYKDRIFTVKYKDFVKRPTDEWKKICDFLDIPFEENCLGIKFRNAAIKSENHQIGVVASETDWSKILSESEIRLANAINGRKLRSLGYTVADDRNFLRISWYFLLELPGVFRRILKRYRMFSLGYFYIYLKSMLRRF